MKFTDDEIQRAARTCHEVNRAYCAGLGDSSQPAWEQAPEWQRESAIKGVDGVIAGNTPEQSHQSWLEAKLAAGWRYGPIKNPAAKLHPCMVAYGMLPVWQRYKDTLFVTAARGVLGL